MISLSQWFFSSSVLILAVLALRAVFAKKLSLVVRYALWSVVLLRLLLPIAPFTASVSVSVLSQPIQEQAETKMLYAFPTRTYENQYVYEQPHYSRTEHTRIVNFGGKSYEYANYLSGGSVSHQGQRTDYLFLMPADELLALIWKLGMLVCAFWILRCNLRFSRALKESGTPYPVPDSPIPVWLVSEGLPTPCLFGLFEPAVYLTPDAVQDETTLRHVLAHELTHFAHKDHIWSALRCVCLVLHWYNPLVWLACGLSKRDGELACDEGAVKRLGEGERLSYGRTLVDMVARRSVRPGDLLTCSTAMAEGKKPIQQRIQLLVKGPKTMRAALAAAVCVTAAAFILVFSGQSNPRLLPFTTYEQFLKEFTSAPTSRCRFLSGSIPEEHLAERDRLLSQGTQVGVWVDRTDYYPFEEPLTADNLYDCAGFTYSPHKIWLYEVPEGCHLLVEVYFESDDPDAWLHYHQIRKQYYHLAILPSGTVQALEELLLPPQPVPLTQEELDFFNSSGFFDDGTRLPGQPGRMNIRNQFLSSFYDDPRDIDLFDLFYNGTGQSDRSIEETQQILNAIIDSGAFYPETGCTTLTTAEIDAVLTQHMGLTLEETNKVGLEYMDYLSSHDVYYHFHGDTNYGATPRFSSGERIGDTIRLYYQDTFGLLGYIPCVLTLRQEGENYHFYSNQPRYADPAIGLSVPDTGDPSADMQTFADELRMRYIFLNRHHHRAVHTAKFYRMEELSKSHDQMCVRLSLAIDPLIQNTYAWDTQRGLMLIKVGPHTGLYDFTLDYLLQLQDGYWTCIETANGGLTAGSPASAPSVDPLVSGLRDFTK